MVKLTKAQQVAERGKAESWEARCCWTTSDTRFRMFGSWSTDTSCRIGSCEDGSSCTKTSASQRGEPGRCAHCRILAALGRTEEAMACDEGVAVAASSTRRETC